MCTVVNRYSAEKCEPYRENQYNSIHIYLAYFIVDVRWPRKNNLLIYKAINRYTRVIIMKTGTKFIHTLKINVSIKYPH